MSDLLPCPFCGGTDVHTSPNGENYAYVYCNTCGAEGPTNDIGSVVMTWNRRAQPAQAVPPDVVRDAARYRWLRSQWFTMGASYPDSTVQFHLGNKRWSEQPESNLDAAIDAAMAQGAKT